MRNSPTKLLLHIKLHLAYHDSNSDLLITSGKMILLRSSYPLGMQMTYDDSMDSESLSRDLCHLLILLLLLCWAFVFWECGTSAHYERELAAACSDDDEDSDEESEDEDGQGPSMKSRNRDGSLTPEIRWRRKNIY